MNIPSTESLYVISLKEVFWGGLLIAITMTMHGLGMLTIIRISESLKLKFEKKTGFVYGVLRLILASWMILVVHLIEVVVWASFFLWKGAFPNHSVAYYFSLNEYTTVGSNYNLPLDWRLLEGMIATAGLLTFAWSTGVLLTLAQDFQDQQMKQLKEKRDHRPSRRGISPAAGTTEGK